MAIRSVPYHARACGARRRVLSVAYRALPSVPLDNPLDAGLSRRRVRPLPCRLQPAGRYRRSPTAGAPLSDSQPGLRFLAGTHPLLMVCRSPLPLPRHLLVGETSSPSSRVWAVARSVLMSTCRTERWPAIAPLEPLRPALDPPAACQPHPRPRRVVGSLSRVQHADGLSEMLFGLAFAEGAFRARDPMSPQRLTN